MLLVWRERAGVRMCRGPRTDKPAIVADSLFEPSHVGLRNCDDGREVFVREK